MSDQMRGDIVLKADDALKQRILERVGKTEGIVRIEQAEWNFGYCDTCSWPEEGLAVHVDGEQVWPNSDVLARLGGNSLGDDTAHYSDGVVQVAQYGLFYDWLLGATPEELEEIEAKSWEGDDDEHLGGGGSERWSGPIYSTRRRRTIMWAGSIRLTI